MKKWVIGILVAAFSFLAIVALIWGIKMAVVVGEVSVLVGALASAFICDYLKPMPGE